MRRSITAPLGALVALGGLAVSARAGSITGDLSGDTTLKPISQDVFLQTFTGEGDDTLLGSFTVQSQSTVDFSKPSDITISKGTFSETFSQGTLAGTTSGDGARTGPGTGRFEMDLVFTGGTGLFAGARGGATITGTITTTSPTTGEITGS